MLHFDFDSKEDIIKTFSDEDKCINHLETLRWNGAVISPFDTNSKVYFCNKSTYKCKNSGKYFNVKTKTLFHDTKIPLQKWFVAIWIISSQNKKINSVALSKELQITQKSAWYMIKRIKFFTENNDNTFNKKINHSLVKTHNVPIRIARIEVAVEQEKLPLLQWLQSLKK